MTPERNELLAAAEFLAENQFPGPAELRVLAATYEARTRSSWAVRSAAHPVDELPRSHQDERRPPDRQPLAYLVR